MQLVSELAVGISIGEPLDLGRQGSSNRLVYYWDNPEKLGSSDVGRVMRLRNEGVLTRDEHPANALNVVRTLNAHVASVIVLLPFVISAVVCVVWSVVASVVYQADIQASVQTAFTVGSYIVTAGKLLWWFN